MDMIKVLSAELNQPASYIENVIALMDEGNTIPFIARYRKELTGEFCRGCGYCMPCPKGVDIPGTFAAYNRLYSENKFAGLKEYFMCTAFRKNATGASNCIGCGKCEKHCPQGINIREQLKNAKKEFEGPVYKTACKIITRFTKF